MSCSLKNSGPYLLVAPRGCDVLKSPRGSSRLHSSAAGLQQIGPRQQRRQHPVGKDECSRPIGKDESAPLLTPMSPNTCEQDSQSAPSAPLSNLFVLKHLQEKVQLRPSAPLRKSFRINKGCKIRAPRKLNEFNQLQNRAPAKSFRMIAFQKNSFFAATCFIRERNTT